MATHLPEIMPGLVKAYDNVESSVRKVKYTYADYFSSTIKNL